MTHPRWTVRWSRGRGAVDPPGWVVFDRDRRVSVPWANYGEALRRATRIAALYARWGW